MFTLRQYGSYLLLVVLGWTALRTMDYVVFEPDSLLRRFYRKLMTPRQPAPTKE